MAYPIHSPLTPAGAPVTSCDLDEACLALDCNEVMDEFGDMLLESNDGQEFLAYYCGLDYVEKLPEEPESGK
jgi:hypothetical protein